MLSYLLPKKPNVLKVYDLKGELKIIRYASDRELKRVAS